MLQFSAQLRPVLITYQNYNHEIVLLADNCMVDNTGGWLEK